MEYDPLGNLAREIAPGGAERRFTHDAFNQLRSVSVVTPPAVPGGSSTEATIGLYDYDFEGRRIHRATADEELYYVYNGLNVTNEYDRWGQLAAGYDFGLPGGMTAAAQWQLLGNRLHSGVGSGNGWTPDFGAPGDLARANFAGEGERFYFHDALGSTTMLASLAPPPGGGLPVAALAARYDYDPWGSQLNPAEPSSNRVNFTTYRHDAETGLEYAMARYYQAGGARFLEEDILPDLVSTPFLGQGLRGDGSYISWVTTSRYPYGLGNPPRFLDPDGRDERDRVRKALELLNHDPPLQYVSGGHSEEEGMDCRGLVYLVYEADPDNKRLVDSNKHFWHPEEVPILDLLKYDYSKKLGSGVVYQMDIFQREGQFITDITKAKPGDAIFLRHNGNGGYHTGIVVSAQPDRISYVHSSSPEVDIIRSDYPLDNRYLTKSFLGYGRPKDEPRNDPKPAAKPSQQEPKKEETSTFKRIIIGAAFSWGQAQVRGFEKIRNWVGLE
jgi:RHS repeat-associated protein